jgi:hypothetical protein
MKFVPRAEAESTHERSTMMETTLHQNLVAGALSPADARAIAKEAYIYGFPIVDSYRILYAYFGDPNNPEFKAPWN